MNGLIKLSKRRIRSLVDEVRIDCGRGILLILTNNWAGRVMA